MVRTLIFNFATDLEVGVQILQRQLARSNWLPLFAGWMLMLTVSGCGTSGPRIVPVKGTVYYRAEPVKSGEITFAPISGKGQPALALINPDGSFTAKLSDSQPGLLESEYKVIITSFKLRPDQISPSKLATMGNDNLAVPKKYTDQNTTDLIVSITGQDRTKEVELELVD